MKFEYSSIEAIIINTAVTSGGTKHEGSDPYGAKMCVLLLAHAVRTDIVKY